jgi:hypothetical protein
LKKHLKYLISFLLIFDLTVNHCFIYSQTNPQIHYQVSQIHSRKEFRHIHFKLYVYGVIAFIGLNTIDFISWSFGNDNDGRNAFFNQLANTPAIAVPFVYVGPSMLFLGLSAHTVNFVKSNLVGFILTFSGAIFTGLSFFLWSNLIYTAFGVTVFALGLILILNEMNEKQTLHNRV